MTSTQHSERSSEPRGRWLRALAPVAVIVLALAGAVSMVSARRDVETRSPERALPLVKAMAVERRSTPVWVQTQGTVAPRTETELVVEVSGRIVWVSPDLASGGFVEPDEVLARIDAADYEMARERAEASLERAQSEWEVARSQLERVESLSESGIASPSRLDDARSRERVAAAVLRETRAMVDQARRDLDRTRIRAPYAGRVREKHVDVGQFVSRGAPIARIYAVDYAEVRLPITDDEAAFVDLPIDYRDGSGDAHGPRVILRARFAGREYAWQGRIVRTEGEIDPRTRMIHAVARVDDPYGHGDDPERPPLAVGLFVDAEIEGRRVDGVFVLPRSALRNTDEVAVVDREERLRMRRVEVVRRERDRVLVGHGLESGDRVCASTLPLSVEGMLVRVAPIAADAEWTAVAETRSAP